MKKHTIVVIGIILANFELSCELSWEMMRPVNDRMWKECTNEITIDDQRSQSFEPEFGCTTVVSLTPGLTAQVTCDSVSHDQNVKDCSDKVLSITTGNGQQEQFCITYDSVGLTSSIDRLFIGETRIELLVDYRQRNMNDKLSSCTISTRRLEDRSISGQRSYLSIHQGALELANFALFNPELDCGKVNFPPNTKSRIVGGQEVEPHNYPWMVVIVKQDFAGRRILCGGSIIATTKVLTAAHCVDGAAKIRVYYGVHKLSEATDVIQMTSFVIHPGYEFPNHDLAIITLNTPLAFSEKVRPVCMPTVFSSGVNAYQYIIGLGWGRTKSSSLSDVLKENMFQVITDKTCKKTFGEFLDNTIMCTKDTPGQSVCQGDSGSAVGKMEHRRFVLYGVISFTASSCSDGFPAGYTEIAPHMAWIIKNI